MLENRSFDHLLGYLKHEGSFPDLEHNPAYCPVDPRKPDRNRIRTSDDASSVLGTDPDHAHKAVMLQMYGTQTPDPSAEPRMDGLLERPVT